MNYKKLAKDISDWIKKQVEQKSAISFNLFIYKRRFI